MTNIDHDTIDSAYREQRTVVGRAIGKKQADLNRRWATHEFRNPAVARTELMKIFEGILDAALNLLMSVHFLAGDQEVAGITARLQKFVNDTPLSRTPADQTARELAESRAEFDGLKAMHARRVRDRVVVALQEFLARRPAERSRENIHPGSPAAKIVIGHGRSPVWREVRDFLRERLKLDVDEFNSIANAGKSTKERLTEMKEAAGMAFLIMTAEDEQADGDLRARQNVVHEIGFFQGALGFERAIILLEEGCKTFSNVDGITYVAFPKGHINAAYEQVRQTLEREGFVRTKIETSNERDTLHNATGPTPASGPGTPAGDLAIRKRRE